jgi:hypothetical protein
MQDLMIIETSEDKRYRVRLAVDESAHNPREDYDQIVYAVTLPHSRYNDIAEAGPLVDGWERIKEYPNAVDLFERWARIFHGAVTLHDTPHEGPGAIWYIMPAGIAEVPDPRAALEASRDEYRAWASGDVYGYIIEEAVDWRRVDGKDDDGMTTWEEVDADGSCWGLIGYQYAEGEAKQEFAAFLKDKSATA